MSRYSIIAAFFALTLITIRVESQEAGSYSGLERVLLGNPSLTTGIHFNSFYQVTQDHYRSILPSSEILRRDYTEMELQDLFFWYFGFTPLVVSASAGVMIKDKDSEEVLPFPKFRFGISYHSGNMLAARFHRENVTRVDTTLLPGTGQILYIDSVHRTIVNVEHISEQLFFDLALEFSTSTTRRLSVKSGLGVSSGLPLMSFASIRYIDDHLRITSLPGGKVVSTTNELSIHESEVLAEGSFWVLMPYIPLTIDLRLGSFGTFFGQISLRYEGRAGLRMVMAGAGTPPASLRRHHSIGLALSW